MSIRQVQKLFDEANELTRNQNWSAAVAKWDEVMPLLQGHEEFIHVYTRRGNAKRCMGDYTGAIADFDQAIAVALDREIVVAPEQRNNLAMSTYYSRGLVKRDTGDYVGAIADLDRVIRISPEYAEVYNDRGLTKAKMGEYEGAIADFDQAIKFKSQYAAAYYNRGVTKDHLGDHKGAIANFDQAITSNTEYAEAYNSRGNAKSSMGDYEGAIADYDRSLEIAPEHKSTVHNRAAALAMRESQKGREEIEARYQAQLRTQQEKFDRNMQDQLRTQQEKFDRNMQEQLQAHQKKFEEEFAEKSKRIQKLAKALSPGEKKSHYDTKLGVQKGKIVNWMRLLAGLSALIFGIITVKGWTMLQGKEDFSPLFFLPFIVMGSLVLFPLVWHIRMLNRDKHKYWALREDAEAKEIMATIADGNPDHYKELLMRLFDHYDKRGSAHLIADWSRADTSGGNSIVSVDSVLKPGDKGGD